MLKIPFYFVLTTEIMCSCLLAVQLSTSKNGRESPRFRFPLWLVKKSFNVEDDPPFGESGVEHRDRTSGYNFSI